MNHDGYYYLHENGNLIWKRYLDADQETDFRESPFVRHFWRVDTSRREDAWTVLVEALALAHTQGHRIEELAEKWGCNDADAVRYAERIGIVLTREEDWYAASIINDDGVTLMPRGYGKNCLYAMADLCTKLGFRANKTAGESFRALVADMVDKGTKT